MWAADESSRRSAGGQQEVSRRSAGGQITVYIRSSCLIVAGELNRWTTARDEIYVSRIDLHY